MEGPISPARMSTRKWAVLNAMDKESLTLPGQVDQFRNVRRQRIAIGESLAIHKEQESDQLEGKLKEKSNEDIREDIWHINQLNNRA